jgi:hypothetical protein
LTPVDRQLGFACSDVVVWRLGLKLETIKVEAGSTELNDAKKKTRGKEEERKLELED